MRTISKDELTKILADHKEWRRSDGALGSRADLRVADLGGAYLGDADLRGADLGGAYLGDADLRGADLGGAYLRSEPVPFPRC
jgi:uncharacterized protein YjbI with pentapeptide repeats